IYLIYTTACNFCLYMVARLQFSVSRMAEFRHDAHKHTHTDTCAHTQVSTLPPADRIGLKNKCTATDTFKVLRTHFQPFMNPLTRQDTRKCSRMRPNENGYTRRGKQNVRQC